MIVSPVLYQMGLIFMGINLLVLVLSSVSSCRYSIDILCKQVLYNHQVPPPQKHNISSSSSNVPFSGQCPSSQDAGGVRFRAARNLQELSAGLANKRWDG